MHGLQAYDPVLTWAQTAMQTSFTVSDSIFGTAQDEAAVQAVQAFLEGETAQPAHILLMPSPCMILRGLPTCWGRLADNDANPGLDKWELAAVDSLGGACKSLLLASAVIKVGKELEHAWLRHLVTSWEARFAGPRPELATQAWVTPLFVAWCPS